MRFNLSLPISTGLSLTYTIAIELPRTPPRSFPSFRGALKGRLVQYLNRLTISHEHQTRTARVRHCLICDNRVGRSAARFELSFAKAVGERDAAILKRLKILLHLVEALEEILSA